MIRRVFIFLLIILIVPLFCFNSIAVSSGTAYFITDNTYTDLSILNINGDSITLSSDNGFSLYFPSTLYNYTILPGTSYFVCSGSFCIDFTSVGTYNLSTVYPSHLRSVLTENGTYRNNVDITQSYNSTLGVTRYSASNLSFVSQTHFLPTSDSLVFSFVFVSSAASRIDTCIDYVIPSFGGALTCSEFKIINVEAPSTAVEDSINTLITTTTSGFGGVETAVNALSSLTQSNFASTEQLLNSLDSAISDLKGSVTESVYDALDDWHHHEADFVQSDLNPIVQGVVDDINELYDYDAFYGAFNSIVNMVTGGNTRAAPTTRLRIPAGVVTVGGHTYRFWEETYVDFGPVFENEMIQLLLIPFRFIVAYGFLKYCLYWINKLINAITLNIKAGAG